MVLVAVQLRVRAYALFAFSSELAENLRAGLRNRLQSSPVYGFDTHLDLLLYGWCLPGNFQI